MGLGGRMMKTTSDPGVLLHVFAEDIAQSITSNPGPT